MAFAAYRDELLQGGGRQQGFLRLALETTGTPEEVFKAYWDAVRSHLGEWNLQRAFLRDCLKLGMTSEVRPALDADIALLSEKMRAMPKEIDLRLCLALALLARGERHEAAVEFRKALELTQKDPAKCNDVAWTLATSSQAGQRDGRIAVEFATRACELTAWKDANNLDTLAAAHAEAGDFESAVRHRPRLSHWSAMPSKRKTLASDSSCIRIENPSGTQRNSGPQIPGIDQKEDDVPGIRVSPK